TRFSCASRSASAIKAGSAEPIGTRAGAGAGWECPLVDGLAGNSAGRPLRAGGGAADSPGGPGVVAGAAGRRGRGGVGGRGAGRAGGGGGRGGGGGGGGQRRRTVGRPGRRGRGPGGGVGAADLDRQGRLTARKRGGLGPLVPEGETDRIAECREFG